ncbi:hypothetical protein ACU8V3_01400 [Cobetia marina]
MQPSDKSDASTIRLAMQDVMAIDERHHAVVPPLLMIRRNAAQPIGISAKWLAQRYRLAGVRLLTMMIMGTRTAWLISMDGTASPWLLVVINRSEGSRFNTCFPIPMNSSVLRLALKTSRCIPRDSGGSRGSDSRLGPERYRGISGISKRDPA